ncbi:metal-dependent hydrolase [Nocardia otitidiscaviarum]|uniref:metal-dependent hydrolase n=1 Tax=Nocardia otitidiscaviarum TaxID=1823 RepID=UPI00189303E0|nr:metal-dependent hydrolase [Nocardia otitidiscaviarum]MBF6137436.1 metal-dependent hydrolase [Nocardia otitidiscaviarum]
MTTTYPQARRIRFRFGDPEPMSKYYAGGDIVFSHFIAGLSAGFPPGEESFIRSVRKFADHITDPALKKRVAGFIGQEAMHGQEHRRLNGKLAELGYPVEWYDSPAAVERLRRIEQRLPDLVHLASTAAAEHYTTVLATRVLTRPEVQELAGDPEVRNLLNWHAVEEIEHKSVAFDVYRAVGGSERMRITTMATVLALTLPLTTVGLILSLRRDDYARAHPARLVREAYTLFTGPLFRGLGRELAQYLRPGFHPDDNDTTALLDRWRAELFGDTGVLSDHLR